MFRLQRILLSSQAAKLKAVRRVTQDNRGKKTAGMDGIKFISPEKRVELSNSLILNGRASPIKKVYIPKSDKKFRPLEIPNIEDRAKQFLVLMVLELQWEAKFESNSYGFRPGRSRHDAIEAIFIAINQKPKFFLDADIQRCFNEINHDALLSKLETFPLIEKQIKSWLKAGVLENDVIVPNEKGTPQGSLVSPLLMNIALHGLENAVVNFMKGLKTKGDDGKYIVKRRRARSINTIKYADDFVILHEHPLVVKECKKFVQNFLSIIGLTLNENKTHIGRTLDWFEEKPPGLYFLGFNIRQYKIGKYAIRKTKAALPYRTLICPSKSKVKEHYKSIKEILKKLKKQKCL
uniref:Reverse transcriptase domain-containing protein n=1 Tax=Halamphora calidilacuna TaxID=2133758 RepID=A0A2R4A3Q3_9STRA|nr:hypothetical protein [Halamphora calidilacuna]